MEVRWPARMQRLDNGPLSRLLTPGSELWLDGAHNPAGAEAIAQDVAGEVVAAERVNTLSRFPLHDTRPLERRNN